MLVAASLTDKALWDLARSASGLEPWDRRLVAGIGAAIIAGRAISAEQRRSLELLAERILTAAGRA